MFAPLDYDKVPEVSLPSELKSNVTLTQTALKKNIMEKNKRIREELKNLHRDPHPFFRIFPLESDLTFWKILMQGPPETPYEQGVFQLYCQFSKEYPVKPPLVRFLTPIYHCNINSVGRICHNIFDRNYNAHITMREILNAVFGLLIAPEPEDPLDSILAEEYLSDLQKYLQEAKKQTKETANLSMEEIEKTMFINPVKTIYGTVYERKAIEQHLKQHRYDPLAGPEAPLKPGDLTPAWDMKKMVTDFRSGQIK
ncbi:ubiquitin-conjugating enzyme E2 2-like [Neosynchiropus ocellatus]